MNESITELSRIWSKTLEDLKGKLTDGRVFDIFLSGSYIKATNDKDKVLVVVNSGLAKEILTNKYNKDIADSLKVVTGLNLTVEYVDKDSVVEDIKEEKIQESSEFFNNVVINESHTFDNFIPGPYNLEAYQAAFYIATNPGTSYNPLFIFSNSGLGKTHLLEAIYNYIKEKNPSKKALLINADDFITEFIKFVTGEKEQDKLKNFIISHDVLLVDDIQMIANKKETEAFFFTIFQKFYSKGKQIVLTSDKHPSELKGFENRLVTRFQSGLSIAISTPDTQTCVEILKSKISASTLSLDAFDTEVLELIASKFSKNIRQIDEALNRLMFYTTFTKPTQHIDINVAYDALQSLLDIKESKQKLSEQKIINIVAEYYHLTPSQITGVSRQASVALPRQIAMYLISSMLNISFNKIGYTFGGKDHSTVMYSISKVEKELKTNTALQTAIQQLKEQIK